MTKQQKSGYLTRLGKEASTGRRLPLFTLNHWSPQGYSITRVPPIHKSPPTLHVTQIASVNWLLRWTLLAANERYTRQLSRHESYQSKKSSCYIGQEKRPKNTKQISKKFTKRTEERLLAKVGDLPDKRFFTILKYIFMRWLTWANVFELILIILLTCCLVYHCHGLLGDYYSYPSFVSNRKQRNNNFWADLPAVTLCSNNRMSREQIRRHFPQLNDSHFKAMELGTFYSVNNFTIDADSISADNWTNYSFLNKSLVLQQENQQSPVDYLGSPKIDFEKVVKFMSEDRIYGLKRTFPSYDLVANTVCYSRWGDPLPCANLKRVVSHQWARKCDTLFHQSAFWDPNDAAVLDLKETYEARLANLEKDNMDEQHEQQTAQRREDSSGYQESGLRPSEIIRLWLDFRAHDYMNNRSSVGGTLSIHSNGLVASMSHISYNIKPGYWYSYFIERTDYRRLPPPYSSACYSYQPPSTSADTPVEAATGWTSAEKKRTIAHLASRQSARPDKPLRDYVSSLRERSISARHCSDLCEAELSAVKCNCWPTQVPYILANNDLLDENRTLGFCGHESLLRGGRGRAPAAGEASGAQQQQQQQATVQGAAAGDDVQFQVCARNFVPLCTSACPADCSLSTFDSTEQWRPWPSHESLRYLRNPRLVERLKSEAKCCATVSVLYIDASSNLYSTTAKYSGQDVVTTISGNVEAWIGVSAVHGYLFLERLHQSLLEAGLLMGGFGFWSIFGRLGWLCGGLSSWCSCCSWLGFGGSVGRPSARSILTNWRRVKLSKLFASPRSGAGNESRVGPNGSPTGTGFRATIPWRATKQTSPMQQQQPSNLSPGAGCSVGPGAATTGGG